MTPFDMPIPSVVQLPTYFQLVDEQGDGEPYAGLAYEVVDELGCEHYGYLDANGQGSLNALSGGYGVLRFTRLQGPRQITELQVRAEQTRCVNQHGARTRNNPAHYNVQSDYYQVEVRHLVEHVSHLPPAVECHDPLDFQKHKRMYAHADFGVCLTAGHHTVLEIRPLRALSLMLSSSAQHCALNLYQMALLATKRGCAVEASLGQANTLREPAYRPLYEDVAYSKRFQVIPGALNQAFMAQSHDVLLIAIREPRPAADFLNSIDSQAVLFEEGQGRVHRGFYLAAKQLYAQLSAYLEKDLTPEKVLMCGHGVSGAIALILGQMLRHRSLTIDVQLYTYGAPRAGDAAFVKAAESLMHSRVVNHHDPLPSMPGSWMNTKLSTYRACAAVGFNYVPPELSVFVAGLSVLTQELYQHHGTLYHFMPLDLGQEDIPCLLWSPTSDIVTQHAVSRVIFNAVQADSEGDGLVGPLVKLEQSFGVDSYIPSCWVALRQAQAALEAQQAWVAEHEVKMIDLAFEHIAQQLRSRYQAVVSQSDADLQIQERMINLLMRELSRLHTTRQRLYDMRFQVPSLSDVYGSCAQSPALLKQNLERWQAPLADGKKRWPVNVHG
ncbi:lipase family protein [Pseudomonas sp. SIMBA_077]